MSKHITGQEVAMLLRLAMNGDLPIRCDKPGITWHEMGDIGFRICDILIVIFNDCGDFDYVDRVEYPSGRRGEFEQWFADKDEPERHLTSEETGRLNQWLSSIA